MCTHPTTWSTKPVHSHPPFSWLASGASVDACARRRTVDIKRGGVVICGMKKLELTEMGMVRLERRNGVCSECGCGDHATFVDGILRVEPSADRFPQALSSSSLSPMRPSSSLPPALDAASERLHAQEYSSDTLQWLSIDLLTTCFALRNCKSNCR